MEYTYEWDFCTVYIRYGKGEKQGLVDALFDVSSPNETEKT